MRTPRPGRSARAAYLPEWTRAECTTGQSERVHESETGHCARCGQPINRTAGAWTPTAEGELCSNCHTGHGPGWQEFPEPDWWFGRWLRRSRVTRWAFHEDL
jgi:hypothetical protein